MLTLSNAAFDAHVGRSGHGAKRESPIGVLSEAPDD